MAASSSDEESISRQLTMRYLCQLLKYKLENRTSGHPVHESRIYSLLLDMNYDDTEISNILINDRTIKSTLPTITQFEKLLNVKWLPTTVKNEIVTEFMDLEIIKTRSEITKTPQLVKKLSRRLGLSDSTDDWDTMISNYGQKYYQPITIAEIATLNITSLTQCKDIINQAINDGNIEVVSHLLNNDIIIDDLIMLAARRGRCDMMEFLLSKTNNPEHHYNIIMVVGARNGRRNVVEYILQRCHDSGIDVDFNSIMMVAVRNFRPDIARLIREKSVAAGKKIINGNTMIMAKCSNTTIIDKNINTQLELGRAIDYGDLMLKMTNEGHLTGLFHIINIAKKFDSCPDYEKILLIAIKHGRNNIIVAILKKNVEININRLLFEAVRYGRLDIVELLTDYNSSEVNYNSVKLEANKRNWPQIYSYLESRQRRPLPPSPRNQC